MDLWIRSQDKECIMLVNRLDIDNTKIVANGFETTLATYKTSKRAQEVLDDIIEFLKPKFLMDGYNITSNYGDINQYELHFKEPNIFADRVYELPMK